jgi:hypothetical protein
MAAPSDSPTPRRRRLPLPLLLIVVGAAVLAVFLIGPALRDRPPEFLQPYPTRRVDHPFAGRAPEDESVLMNTRLYHVRADFESLKQQLEREFKTQGYKPMIVSPNRYGLSDGEQWIVVAQGEEAWVPLDPGWVEVEVRELVGSESPEP